MPLTLTTNLDNTEAEVVSSMVLFKVEGLFCFFLQLEKAINKTMKKAYFLQFNIGIFF
jgi:hypothetical protein